MRNDEIGERRIGLNGSVPLLATIPNRVAARGAPGENVVLDAVADNDTVFGSHARCLHAQSENLGRGLADAHDGAFDDVVKEVGNAVVTNDSSQISVEIGDQKETMPAVSQCAYGISGKPNAFSRHVVQFFCHLLHGEFFGNRRVEVHFPTLLQRVSLKREFFQQNIAESVVGSDERLSFKRALGEDVGFAQLFVREVVTKTVFEAAIPTFGYHIEPMGRAGVQRAAIVKKIDFVHLLYI